MTVSSCHIFMQLAKETLGTKKWSKGSLVDDSLLAINLSPHSDISFQSHEGAVTHSTESWDTVSPQICLEINQMRGISPEYSI
jgi:hypothetical protein